MAWSTIGTVGSRLGDRHRELSTTVDHTDPAAIENSVAITLDLLAPRKRIVSFRGAGRYASLLNE